MDTPSPLEFIFFAALAKHPEAERKAYLEEACAGDAALRSRVERMLAAHDEAGSFLERQAVTLGATLEAGPAVTERPGAPIGPYKLLQQIGEGGMGVVFMAEQTRPIQRTVALKIIKPGMDTRQVIARFEAERQALAVMDHPNIAKVLDAGTTESGRPYFVMELVKGVPITRYCDEKRLTLRERLELLLPVCQAVQHAHQKGLIHRDIKPTNVLVAEYDHHAVPKVIDFGVAKATAQKLTDRTMFTEFGQVLGTVEYMSPEQAKLNQLDVDTRSDVYSLGVLLYELLTGSTPFVRERLRAAAFDEVLRIIREEEPPKPSTRLSTAEALPSIAANRGVETLKLNRLVRGDLDWVVMKALEKDRNRRYETATSLGEDVQRYLNDQAVRACPPSATYQLRKFTRRHKLGVAAGLAIATTLLLGAAGTTVGMVWARREQRAAQASAAQARTEAARSNEVAQFLKDMLQGVGPSVALGRDTTMLREVVDRTAERIQADLKDQPDVRLELSLTLTDVYFRLQEYQRMEQAARQSLALARTHLGPESLPAADALGQLGMALSVGRSLEEAETVLRQAIAMQRMLRGGESVQEADSLCALGNVLRHQGLSADAPASDGKFAEAETFNRSGLTMLRKHLGNDNDKVSAALFLRSMILMDSGKPAEAEDAIRESAAIRDRVHGDNYPSLQFGFMTYILLARGKLDEAEACGRKALEVERRMGLTGRLSQVNAHSNLGQVLVAKGKLDEAEAHYREAVAIARKVLDPENRDMPGWLAALAKVLRSNGKVAEARPLAEEAVAICNRHFDQIPRWGRDNAVYTLKDVLLDLQDTAALDTLAAQSIGRAESIDDPDQLAKTYGWAIPLLANPQLQREARDRCRKIPASAIKGGWAAHDLAWFLVTAENPALRDAAAGLELAKRAAELNPKAGEMWALLGIARYRAGDFKQAIAELQTSITLRNRGSSEEFFFLAMSHSQLGSRNDARIWLGKGVQWMEQNPNHIREIIQFHEEAAGLMPAEAAPEEEKPD